MFPTRFEIIPSAGIAGKLVAAVPQSTTLTITCLPHHGIARTMQSALELRELGYDVVPHIAARALESRGQLAGIVRDCESAGITEIFAIGGDAQQPAGPYGTSRELLEDLAEHSGGRITAGVAGYPEGHPAVGGLELVDDLLAKQHLAARIVTQMCFSAPEIHGYAALLRREGVTLPVWAGVAGAVPRAKLLSLATQIGVGSSMKFLGKQKTLARKLFLGDRYSPGNLVAELADPAGSIAGIHLYSFNNLQLPEWMADVA
ncbi:methylenetetrahydrofolate reductase [Arthrobacter silvisoli]|uniref:methylenetetrahydrofolate reductase n=1 Tax=Arthrobacter silvisoli TaxID=2291022 RepID=UPI000E218FDA|nr:methylenetetrahydrofolate reductase [Arthrobacter silvisoli]